MNGSTNLISGVPENLALCRLTIDHGAMCDNWRHLNEISPNTRTGAVVKADAYGLGLEEVVGSLSNVGCEVFFVATPHEGIRARRINDACEIFVFAGLSMENAGAYAESNLIPVLNTLDDIGIWAEYWKKRGSRKPCAIQIDTGMNRLGLSAEDVEYLAQNKELRHSVTIMSVFSHLACADKPEHPMNKQQLALFVSLSNTFPGSELSLANSAGLFMGSDFHFDLARPGIAIYGGESLDDCSHTLKPAVTAHAKILQIRKIKKGESIGYGATHLFKRDATIAIAACGYADGLHRATSGSGVLLRENGETSGGHGYIGEEKVAVLGRVSMDTAAFDVSNIAPDLIDQEPYIELFGPNILLGDVARSAGTISYEILTSIGSRYMRRHINLPESQNDG